MGRGDRTSKKKPQVGVTEEEMMAKIGHRMGGHKGNIGTELLGRKNTHNVSP